VKPDVYQWWFELPNGEYEGKQTRRFGFLVYAAIMNKGRRITTITSWRVKIRALNNHTKELEPLTISEPTIQLGELGVKSLAVLGIRGTNFSGEMIARPGEGVSGFAYYIYEYWGDEKYSPNTKDGRIVAQFVVKDIFNKQRKSKIIFRKKSLEEVQEIIPNIHKIK
jgi:hypothetical protein